MKKFNILIFSLLLLILSVSVNAEAVFMRIGLSFGSSSVSKAVFSFVNGFQVGYFDDNNAFCPAADSPSNSVYAQKKENGTFQIFDTASQNLLFETEKGKEVVICPQGDDRKSCYTIYGGIKYPYYILLSANADSSFNVINYVESEQYIKGVLPSEVYTSWHEEALKAAAVATRTFTFYSKGGKHKNYGVDLCKTTCCQVYSGISKCAASTNKATDDTAGQVIVYNGKLITAVYHSISGGVTESAAGAWGSNPANFPYLTVVETPFEQYQDLNYGKWSRFITDAELNSLIASSSYKNKLVSGVKSITIDDSTPGYLNNMTITDNDGNSVTLKTSSQISSLFSRYVRSANFTITRVYLPTDTKQSLNIVTAMGKAQTNGEDPVYYLTADGQKTAYGVSGGYYIDGKGYGHGVGMSQHGSQYAALAGYTFYQILGTYYPGTQVVQISELGK